MSQSTIIYVTYGAEASEPGLEASSDQGISLSDLSSPPPATDETDETPSAPAKETTKEGSLVRLRTWISENKMAVAGWVVALLSLIVTVVSMLPSFRSESMSQKALELAEWTALKDFIEHCKQDNQAGLASIACQEALTRPLPPPPHVKTSTIIERWMGNDCNCKQRDGHFYLGMLVFLTSSLVLMALDVAIHKTWDTKFPKCNCAKDTRARVENFAEHISQISYYERIDYNTIEPLDAQVAEARSKHRFERGSRAVNALLNRIETFERGQHDTELWVDEAVGSHTSILITMKTPSSKWLNQINWWIGILIGFVGLALST